MNPIGSTDLMLSAVLVVEAFLLLKVLVQVAKRKQAAYNWTYAAFLLVFFVLVSARSLDSAYPYVCGVAFLAGGAAILAEELRLSKLHKR